jgi:hypothetical protein
LEGREKQKSSLNTMAETKLEERAKPKMELDRRGPKVMEKSGGSLSRVAQGSRPST